MGIVMDKDVMPMNAKEAAMILGVHYKTILNMINDGRLAATKNDSGDWVISDSDLAAREQRITDKEFSAIYAHMAMKMIEKEHSRAVKSAREELTYIARLIIKYADNPNGFNQQIKRLQKALESYKAVEAFTQTVESLRKQVDA
ncbi:helix-turn-helix domain-containing protein [Paenibacillus ginsengarvi]|uniref:Helix-turn-helix domain-containing protein n=2 Tax=Paenibacillus ginsengarvi TaxID=400777 RepID=A0A3B0BUZ0_9BACL|nr:helix-turn-helix domain-containing protein [Paenibacillus ginsengarvi]